MQIENILQKRKETHEETKESLMHTRAQLDKQIQRLENKELNDHVRIVRQNIHEIHDALATMQETMNLLWKRAEQLREELAILQAKTE